MKNEEIRWDEKEESTPIVVRETESEAIESSRVEKFRQRGKKGLRQRRSAQTRTGVASSLNLKQE